MKNVLTNLTCRKVKTGSLCGVVALKRILGTNVWLNGVPSLKLTPNLLVGGFALVSLSFRGLLAIMSLLLVCIARTWESFWSDVKQNSPEVLKLRRSLTSCFLTLSEALWIGTVRL